MNRHAACLAFLLAVLPAMALAADPPKTDPKTEPMKSGPDWSKYVQVSDIVGEVVKADDSTVTVRVSWLVPQGGNTQRPTIGRGNNNMMRPGAQRPPQMKEQHEDYEIKFAEEGMVRWLNIPPKIDEKGKRGFYNEKEMLELRQPLGTKGFAANKTDLKPGTIAEFVLVRSKDVLPAKATTEDLRIKLAVIVGEKATPAKPDKKTDKEKKN